MHGLQLGTSPRFPKTPQLWGRKRARVGSSGLQGPRAEVPLVLVRGCWTRSREENIRFLVFLFPSEVLSQSRNALDLSLPSCTVTESIYLVSELPSGSGPGS